MSRYIPLIISFLLCLVMLPGCSGSYTDSPLVPGDTSAASGADYGNRVPWGFFRVSIDRTNGEVDLVPLRGAMFNCNVQQFLSPPFVPVHHMSVVILPASDLMAGYVECEVTLRHPFLGLEMYKGFDVRGIFMADGSAQGNHDAGLFYGSEDSGDAYMLNPDGYTRWWNSAEFTDSMPLFAYKPGALGNCPYPTATLNPYKYFADELSDVGDVACLDPANRGVFCPTTSPNSRVYQIQFPSDGSMPSFDFNYAIDASWDEPDPDMEPYYPLEAFGPGAQCHEAYYVRMDDTGTDAWYSDGEYGGSVVLNVEVFDWQAPYNPYGVPGEISALWVESDIFTTPVDILPIATASDGMATSSVFTVEISGADLGIPAAGEFSILGTVESASPDSYQPQLEGGEMFTYPDAPLAAYFMGAVTIIPDAPPEGPIVDSIDPDEGYLDFTYTDVLVNGSLFEDGATVKIIKNDDPGVVIDGEDVAFVNSTQLTCTLDLNSMTGIAELGTYDVVVTNPDLQSGTLEGGFDIVEFPCAPNEWGDDFDSFYPGQYPTGWVNFWSGQSGVVSTEQFYSAPNSFKQVAYAYWARYDGHPFTAAGKTYVCYETRVMITDETKGAIMGFAWKKTSSTTGHYAAMVIRGPNYPETYHWYHVLAKINMTNNTWHVWVDGELVKDGTSCGSEDSRDSFTHFIVGLTNFSTGGMSTGYYDDVYLYWE